ncbi:MAG: glycosyltransferase family 4 protein [Pseudomonadota bacterium]
MQPRVLVIAPYYRAFSYARVARELSRRLVEDFELHQFALDTAREDIAEDWVIHSNPGVARDPFGSATLPDVLERVRPQAVVIINDIWLYHRYARILAGAARRPKLLLHCPIDQVPVAEGVSDGLRGLDGVVVFLDFAKRAILDDWALRHARPPPFRIDVIPHGVDAAAFSRLDAGLADRRAVARRTLVPKRTDLDEAVIILNANQNSPRKRLDVTVAGFAAMVREVRRPCFLWLHTDMHAFGTPALRPQMRDLGIEDRVIVSSSKPGGPVFDDATLNLLYNACDIGINTSGGEGWGLVAFEHGATEAAQIVPDNSAPATLWSEAGMLVETSGGAPPHPGASGYRAPCAEAVAEALCVLVEEPDLRATYAARAMHLAQRTDLSWDSVATRWRDLLNRVLAV